MLSVKKKYKFYAAHRNYLLNDKCARIHGHRYEITACIEGEYNTKTQVTILFADIDKLIEPIIQEHDHWLLMDKRDPYYQLFIDNGVLFKEMPCATSAENLAQYFFERISETGLPITELQLRETDSAVVTYKPTNETKS